MSDEFLSVVDENGSVEEFCGEINSCIRADAGGAIPRTVPRTLSRIAPWWTKECQEAVKERNRMFRMLKGSHNYQCLIEYKKAQALVRRAVRKAKKTYWRNFCNSVGRTTPIERVWNTI